MHDHEFCLPDYAPALPEIAQVLEAPYIPGAFQHAEESFERSGTAKRWWTLEGRRGALRIRFERYESYYFAELEGEPDAVAAARAILDRHQNQAR